MSKARGKKMKRFTALSILVILLASLMTPVGDNFTELRDGEVVSFQGSAAVRIDITSPAYIMTADEVITFSATLYDSVNSIVAGEVSWSSTNGTITDDGTFYPWNAGVISIQASSGTLSTIYNMTVEAGIGQSLEISINSASVLEANILTANLLDARGNSKPTLDAVWTVDGEFAGQGTPNWIPQDTGIFELGARLYQMETSKQITVISGSPHEFMFPSNMQIQSGGILKLEPSLVDINGFEMPSNAAGAKLWNAENGTVNSTGWFFASHPGYWNLTVTAGGVSGTGVIRVVPSDATTSQLMIIPSPNFFIAGEKYELTSYRTDNLGYSGTITPPISDFSVTSGSLSQEDGRVFWTPMTEGLQEISVVDFDIASTTSVVVTHGTAIDTKIKLSPPVVSAGQQSTLSVYAFDLAGNEWPVNSTITTAVGNDSVVTQYETWASFIPDSTGFWRFETSWYDTTTDIRFDSSIQFEVGYGELALITLDGQGSDIAADIAFELNPQFFDAYGNQLYDIGLNWTIDGEDSTLEMILSQNNWIPTTVGSHEIQANAAGIFSIVTLSVSAGDARNLITEFDDGFVVKAGVPSEIFIQIADTRQNLAPAEEVVTSMSNETGIFEPSTSGRGYWTFTGKIAGQYDLTLIQDDAEITLSLTIEPGDAVQIFGMIDGTNFQQGDYALLRIYGVDSQGNTVQVEPENTTISCTSGPSDFITGDTWEIEISKSGLDRSCTITWNGLITQYFFDVESVLFGGAVGSTNTAMSLAGFLLGLVLITLIVLVRRAKSIDDEDWIEDEFESDYYDEDDDYEDDDSDDYEDEEDEEDTSHQEDTNLTLSDEQKKHLASEASKLGVMQAAPGTEQGSSGWYVDVSEEVQYWNVGNDGSWTRVE
jgi:hypothetical protein